MLLCWTSILPIEFYLFYIVVLIINTPTLLMESEINGPL